MTSKYSNKNGVKLLVAFAVMAVMFAGAFCIVSDSSDAETETTTAKEVAGSAFIETAITDGKLNGDYILTSTVPLTDNLELDLNGYSITAKSGIDAFVVNAAGISITITDTSAKGTGSITTVGSSTSVIYVNDFKPGNLSIDGGTYNGGYTIIWKGATTNEVDIKNATVNAETAGIWLSYGKIATASISNVTVDSDNIGIYLATCATASVTGSTITADSGSAVEIKSGTVTIDNCKISSSAYLDADSVGYSESGGAVAPITINNAYAGIPGGNVSVTIDGAKGTEKSVITGPTGKALVVITDDCVSYDKDAKAWKKTSTTQDITLSWTGHTDDVKICYLLDKHGVADAEYKGYITVNTITYVADADRLTEASTEVTLLNNITVELSAAFNNTKAITLGDYKLSFVAVQDTADADEETVTITKAVINGKESSSATIAGMKVGASAITFSSGSIVIEGGSVIDSGSGSITITGVAKVIGDTVINGTITMEDGATLIIPEGTKLTVNNGANPGIENAGTGATVQVAGELDAKVAASATSNINVEISSGAIVSEDVAADTKKYNAEGSQTAIGNILTSDLEISTKWYLSNDLVVPEGITVNIVSGGELNLAGKNIVVFGTLNIDAGGMIASTTGSETIYLTKGCEFSNEGTVGLGSASVTVSVDSDEIKTLLNTIAGGADYMIKYDASGKVIVNSVVGIEFSIVKKTTTPSVAYTLAVGGDLTTDLESASVTLDGCFISSDLTISENITVTVTNAVTIQKDVTVTVDGELAISGTLTMTNKATVIVNGYVHGTITAQTGTYETSAGYSTGTTTVKFLAVDPAVDGIYAKNEGVTGIILSVGTYAFIDNTTETPVAKTSQRLYIEGSADYVTIQNNNSTTAAYDNTTLAIEGNAAYVADDAVLSLKTGMIVTNANSIVVEGAIVSADKIDTSVPNYIGTSFAIKTATTPAVTTYYVKPFDVAITEIDAADKKTLTVKDKEVEIASELIVTEGQIIDIDDAVDFYISESGIVTVNSKAKIAGTIDSVDGVLTIMTGGVCSKPTSYASEIKSTGYVQYSGLQIALKNAQAGETIYVNKETTLRSGDLEVKEGVTVIANENVTVVDGNVNIDGKLVMKDGKKIEIQAEKKNIDVGENGELDASDGIVKLAADGKINTDGKTVIAQADTLDLAKYVNGFVYTDEDGNKVITDAQTVINAAAAKDSNKNVTVYGTVSVGDLAVKTNITIDEKATVTIGNATISAGKTVKLIGKTTGTFSAQTGTEETVGAIETSVITVTEASGITIGAGKTVDSMNVETKVMYIFGTLVGKATVDDGVVTIGYGSTNKTLTVDGTATTEAYLVIAEGATVAIPNGMTLVAGCNDVSGNIYSAVTVDGTLDFTKGATISASAADDDCFIVINGTVMIGDEAVFAYDAETILNGEIVISETATKEGTLSIVENIYAYEESAISGKVTISTGKYIMAMAGADMSAAKMNVDATGTSVAFATAFMINGDKYMDVYTVNGVSISTIINDVDFAIEGLNLSGIGTVTNWYKSETYTDEYKIAAGAVTDKNVPALYFNAPKAEVIGTISAGVGLQIYLNGISVENYKVTGGYKLPVGTYKVNIENLSGYDKTNAVISFNGATVADGGSITISEKDFVLTATGAVPSVTPTPEPTPIQPSEKDDSMGITEYLLIVLVILAAILVVVVAIRMMRS